MRFQAEPIARGDAVLRAETTERILKGQGRGGAAVVSAIPPHS